MKKERNRKCKCKMQFLLQPRRSRVITRWQSLHCCSSGATANCAVIRRWLVRIPGKILNPKLHQCMNVCGWTWMCPRSALGVVKRQKKRYKWIYNYILYKCLHSSLLNRLSYRDYSCSRSVSKRLRLFSLANKCLICVLKCVFTELVIQNVSVNVRNQLKKFPGDV